MSGAATDPLPRLAAQFATAVADGSERYDTPGFRVHIWPTPDPFYRNVAIPVDAACTAPDAVAAMLAVFAAHDRLPTVEYFAELWPDLAPALAAQGLALASRGQVMVLAAPPPGPGPGPRSPARLLAPGDPAAAIADFLLGAAEVFGQTTVLAPGEALRFAAGLRRGTLAAAMVRRGRLAVAGASLIGAGAVAELAGVWTLPAFQRQGHARACCRLLLERFFGGGGELAWLSVGEPAAAALYAGLGFGTCGTQLNFADAGPA